MTRQIAPQLDYAIAPSRGRKRVRRAVLLGLLLALIYPTYRYAVPAARAGKMLYLQRRCMTYRAPAERIVYDQDSPTTADRQKMPGFQVLAPAQSRSTENSAATGAAGLLADPLKDFAGYLPSTRLAGATLFLHERTSKTGARRLVILQRTVVADDYPFYFAFGIQVDLIDPATFNLGPTPIIPPRLMQPINWISPVRLPPTKGLRFYAGQADPGDDAHFTIGYELDGRKGLIDGRLADAGNDVVLRVVDGPALDTCWVTQVLP